MKSGLLLDSFSSLSILDYFNPSRAPLLVLVYRSWTRFPSRRENGAIVQSIYWQRAHLYQVKIIFHHIIMIFPSICQKQKILGISSAVLLPSRVTHLVIKKPANFQYHPGDYVYVQIPWIANYEWHPFTISSAPELPGECRKLT